MAVKSKSSPADTENTLLDTLRQKRQRRRTAWLSLLVLAVAVGIVWLTGAYGSALAVLGDLTDSVRVALDRSGSFPVETGVTDPLQVRELADGFVLVGSEDVLLYSGRGALLRSIQPGYASPALTVGNTRFCIYNRGGTSLRVESRTRTLYQKEMEQGILLCSMSRNGSLGVVTASSRYTAQLTVYDPTFTGWYTWSTIEEQGTPVLVRFAADNRRLAVGCLSARDGQLQTGVYFLDTHSDQVTAETRRSGESLLALEWLDNTRVLAVYSDSARVLDPATGEELACYDFGGETLQGVSVCEKETALLLTTRAGSRLVVLNEKLEPACAQELVSADRVRLTRTAVYVLRESEVECLNLRGESQWRIACDAPPRAVLAAKKPLLYREGRVEELVAPAA